LAIAGAAFRHNRMNIEGSPEYSAGELLLVEGPACNLVRRGGIQAGAGRLSLTGPGIFEHPAGDFVLMRRGLGRALLSVLHSVCNSMVKETPSRDDSDARAAFEGEVLPHADRLFRLAMWFVRNRADAEDIVQDTMMQALKSFHRFQPGTNCRAWLTTILQRIVSNRRRAAGRSIVVDDPDDRIAQTAPFVPPVPQELSDELVLGALRRIPTMFQEVILLCDVEDLSYKEAAEALAIPTGTVMSRLHRGRARLRAALAAADALLVGRSTGDRVNTLDERIEAS
jgi:RNA polymerase sigma-70 factor (ECF subfamily)